MNIRSTHGFFYNAELGKVKAGPIAFNRLSVGNGVWIGHNTVVLHPTEWIGDGAVVTSGSIVYSNVPPYAIVSGFPARVVGYRFDKQTIAQLLALRWWERRLDELADLPGLENLREAKLAGTVLQPLAAAQAAAALRLGNS